MTTRRKPDDQPAEPATEAAAAPSLTPPPPATAAEVKKAPRPGMNPEIQLMAHLDRRLSALDPAARARVVSWLTSYHGPTLAERIEQAR